MKKLKRTVTANTKLSKSSALSRRAVYSAYDLYEFLNSIDELRGYPIAALDNKDGSCEFTVGNTSYSIYPNAV